MGSCCQPASALIGLTHRQLEKGRSGALVLKSVKKKVAHEERFLAQFEGTITCGYFMKILTDLKTGACANVQVVVGLCAFRNHFNVHVW